MKEIYDNACSILNIKKNKCIDITNKTLSYVKELKQPFYYKVMSEEDIDKVKDKTRDFIDKITKDTKITKKAIENYKEYILSIVTIR